MRRVRSRVLLILAPLALLAGGAPAAAAPVALRAVPMAIEAPDNQATTAGGTSACTTPAPIHRYAYYHCYTPWDIYAAYGVDQLQAAHDDYGQGQTIVLVDSYGSPTAANDINVFYQTFFQGRQMADGQDFPAPNFDQWYPFGQQSSSCNGKSSGLSGQCAAVGWALESTLDIEWAYAMAPLAHIVLLATPPAETLGVQGLPNMFKAMRMAIDRYPHGTIFSQSFGLAEQTFGGAALQQMESFDQTYAYGESLGDTFLASSGDEGNGGASKQHKESTAYSTNAVGFPAVSPDVTAVGGTQLMYGWTWAPTSTTLPGVENWTPGGDTEALWNECFLFGGGNCVTGGGTSSYFPRQSWQSGQASVMGSARGMPDLAWNAAVNGGVLIYITAYDNLVRPGWHIEGGTSAASPQMGGIVALAEQLRGKPFGNFSPYAYAAGNLDAAAPDSTFFGTGTSEYRDIVPQTFGVMTLDNNQWPQTTAAPYFALTGYDLTTGFGTPRVNNFAPAVAAMP